MSIRRYADPQNVTRIWNAIASSKQNQLEFYKIVKYLQDAEECTQAQAEIYVKQCIRDKLIVLAKPNTKKFELSTYKLTTQDLPNFDGVDWYCFECHKAGEVKQCAKCWRVYHMKCTEKGRTRFESYKATNNYNVYENKKADDTDATINISSDSDDVLTGDSSTNNKSDEAVHSSMTEKEKKLVEKRNYKYNDGLCSVCNIAIADTGCDLSKGEMNYILKFVLDRIRSWLPITLTHTMAPEERPAWLTDSDLTWRSNQLFYEHKDMSVIEVNLNSEAYKQLADFIADVYIVQHNVAVFHGLDSQEYGASELMIRDTIHDVTELKNCPDCYKHSNEKINQKWFCLPCKNEHPLVWAKQKGYPHWPAKILKETPTHYDVRFFGGKYERALLLKNFVKPITTPKESVQLKGSSPYTKAFVKAMEELEYHKRLLIDPEELEKFIANSKPGRKTLNKQKTSMLNCSPQAPNRRSLQPDESFEEPQQKKRRGRPPRVPVNLPREPGPSDVASESTISGNVINISDGEDDEPVHYPFHDSGFNSSPYDLEVSFEPVTSSTENYRSPTDPVGSTSVDNNGMHRLDQPYCDAVEKMRRVLEEKTEKKEIIKTAMDSMQLEIDRLTNNQNDHLKRLFESHNNQISETKKKQWCYNCEQDAIYHCCWNTAYCSQTCQQQHWQAEHKKVCRRKRPDAKE